MSFVEAVFGGRIIERGSEKTTVQDESAQSPELESPLSWLDDPENPQQAADVLRAYAEQIEATGQRLWGDEETAIHAACRGTMIWLTEQHEKLGVRKKEIRIHDQTLKNAFAALLAENAEIQSVSE